MAIETRYAVSPGGHVAYQVSGSGPTDVVFVAEWWNQIETMWEEPLLSGALHRLASFSRLISLDNRGIGLSDPIPLGAPMVLDDWVEDLGAVLDAVGSTDAVLVGCSGGGALSALFAARHPERVRGLVLFNTYARFARAPDHPIGVPPSIAAWGLERIEQQWGTGELLDLLAPSLRHDDHIRQWWARYQRQSMSPGTASAIQRMLFELDIRDALPAIEAPTLVLHRTEDAFVRVDHGRHLADHIRDARFVGLPGNDHVFFAGDTGAFLDEVEGFVTGTKPGPTASRAITTMLFTDIVGSTDRAAAEGDHAWRTLLDRHDAVIRRELDRYRGHEVDRAGDGFFATFDSPGQALDCALAASAAIRQLGLAIRAGVHTGEVELRQDGVSGMGVHVAARVAALGGAGDVLATSTVHDLVVGSGLHFEDRGRHALKGVEREWQVYGVSR